MLYILVAVAAVAAYLFYEQVWKTKKYWKHRDVLSTDSVIFLGDMKDAALQRMSMCENVLKIYEKFPKERYFGISQFLIPTLFVKDLDLIKQITIKDFDHFHDHRNFVDPEVDPLFGKNLFSLKGQMWRDMRPTLSPAFTSSKMKAMFLLMSECAEEFTQYFLKQNKGTQTLEMKDIFTRFTNDMIASLAFGIKCDSLGERNNEFYLMGKKATSFTGFRNMLFFLYGMIPSVLKFFKIPLFPADVSDFFRKIVKETIETREKNNIVRPDMINLLMEARKGQLKHEEESKNKTEDTGFATVEESNIGTREIKFQQELTLDDLTAQAMIFFFGGFDTTSTAMCFMAYELATNPDVQKKLQNEIDQTWKKCNGKLTYDALIQMKYLDMVFSETLRKWPPGFMADRLCTKPYTIPAVNPNEKPLTLVPGNVIMIPWVGIHMDPNYFPNPNKFDPERFSDENKGKIISGSYMPFGSGPRNCIGSRFAILENKVMFYHLLAKFDIVVVDKTRVPLKLSKNQFNLLAEGGFWYGLKPRNV